MKWLCVLDLHSNDTIPTSEVKPFATKIIVSAIFVNKQKNYWYSTFISANLHKIYFVSSVAMSERHIGRKEKRKLSTVGYSAAEKTKSRTIV